MSSSTTAPPCSELAILLIDADNSFRRALAGNLCEDGHHVMEFAAPVEVPLVDPLVRAGAVITDYQRAKGGFIFADALYNAHPQIPILMTTSYWTYYLAAQAARRDFLHLLQKPFDYDVVHGLLHRLYREMRC